MLLSKEEKRAFKKYKKIAGVDEAGRGSLAGPLAIGFLSLTKKEIEKIKKSLKLKSIRDSKQLTEKQRKEIFRIIKKYTKNFGVYFIKPEKIDILGLPKTIENCLEKIRRKSKGNFFFLDGGLKFKNGKNWQTVIKGDQKILIIALASIIAKVKRDDLMKRFSKKFPEYKFENHKGYGTKDHLEKLKKIGPTEIHRFSYKPVFENTSFKERVYFIVKKIPKGKVLTYKEVAEKAGKPKAYRAVGNILNKNKNPKIPCHRVIRTDGKIGGYNKGPEKKKELLKKEGAIHN